MSARVRICSAVLGTGMLLTGGSALTSAPATAATSYKNCAAMNKDYPHGVASPCRRQDYPHPGHRFHRRRRPVQGEYQA